MLPLRSFQQACFDCSVKTLQASVGFSQAARSETCSSSRFWFTKKIWKLCVLPNRTTAGRAAAHRRLDRRRVCLCVGGLRKRVQESLMASRTDCFSYTIKNDSGAILNERKAGIEVALMIIFPGEQKPAIIFKDSFSIVVLIVDHCGVFDASAGVIFVTFHQPCVRIVEAIKVVRLIHAVDCVHDSFILPITYIHV
jgi:hypothetical protein